MATFFVPMHPICYVLYSKGIDKFYIGSSHSSIEERLAKHNTGYYNDKWTVHGVPWEVYLVISCHSLSQAHQLEAHIKRMKSRKYIENLVKYPDIIDRLKQRYS